jgi:hypothetical protein
MIYVDTLTAYQRPPSFPHDRAARLIADTERELDDAAKALAVKRSFRAKLPNGLPFYHLGPAQHAAALARGASLLTAAEFIHRITALAA